MADRLAPLEEVLDALVKGIEGLADCIPARGYDWGNGYLAGLADAAALIRAAKPKLRDAVSG